MDRITQLQDSIQQTAILMVDCLYYLNIRTSNPEITPEAPISVINEAADPPQVFETKRKEFVNNLVRQIQKTNALIESLPRHIDTDQKQQQQGSENQSENKDNIDAELWNKLNQENLDSTTELQQVSLRAKKLVDQVSQLILTMANNSASSNTDSDNKQN